MNNRIFYFNGDYCRLDGSSLTSLTPGEAEAFCLTHRDSTLVGFVPPSQARSLPRFWTQTDLRIKQVRLDEDFRSTVLPMINRELNGICSLVMTWLLSIDPTMISYTSQIPA